MISTAKTRFILAAACLAAASLAGPALAETKSTVHGISKGQFIANCESMNGEVVDNGGANAGCNLQSGTSVVCSFEPPESDQQYGSCDVHTRLAQVDLRGLIGAPDRMSVGTLVPESLTSSGSESVPGMVGGVSVNPGGKGAYLGGAGAGPSSMGDGGPVIK